MERHRASPLLLFPNRRRRTKLHLSTFARHLEMNDVGLAALRELHRMSKPNEESTAPVPGHRNDPPCGASISV